MEATFTRIRMCIPRKGITRRTKTHQLISDKCQYLLSIETLSSCAIFVGRRHGTQRSNTQHSDTKYNSTQQSNYAKCRKEAYRC
jgi:hypothetical protein